MKPPFLLLVNQHPSFPCQLVEKSLWPKLPSCSCAGCMYNYERQKLSALQAGAVVEVNSSNYGFLQSISGETIMPLKAGVYELDTSRWAVEIKTQAWIVNAWENVSSDQYAYFRDIIKSNHVKSPSYPQ